MSRGTIFITGASTGIGRAAAERLARAGYDVIPGLRRPDPLPDPVRPPVQIDLADAETIDTACAEVIERANGNLVGLVNNAGFTQSGPFEVLSVEDWRRQFEVNFFGHLAVTRALLPALLHTKGRIITTGSIGGRHAAPFIGPYSASKFAVRGWMDAMRRELAPQGVHAVLLEPGAIDTPIWDKGNAIADDLLARLTPEQQRRYDKQVAGARKTADFAASHAISADHCAKVIERAMTARRPKGHYVVGTDARLQAAIATLPSGLQDAVTRVIVRQPRRV
jgi:NAD(P)-dependent dehydrogenase (short-subunit alcohol dehydrogenase family)